MTTAEREAIDLRLELAFTRVDMIELGQDVMSYRACFITALDMVSQQGRAIRALRGKVSDLDGQIANLLGVHREDHSNDESE